jgi:hypothetical protein
VVAAFDGGAITSDAGALLLGATDRVIGMMTRFKACFHDERRADLIEHKVVTETPPNWWTPLLSSDGSGKVSNGSGTASF